MSDYKNFELKNLSKSPVLIFTNYRKKIIKKKVYIDSDGFECISEHSDYVDEEIEVKVQDPNISNRLEKKKQVYKPPTGGQSTLSNFFNKR